MKTILKAALVAAAMAVTALTSSTPASAERYYDDRPSFGFYFGTGAPPPRLYGDFGYHDPHCRPVRRVWFDRWGHRHVTWRPACRPFGFRGPSRFRDGRDGRW